MNTTKVTSILNPVESTIHKTKRTGSCFADKYAGSSSSHCQAASGDRFFILATKVGGNFFRALYHSKTTGFCNVLTLSTESAETTL